MLPLRALEIAFCVRASSALFAFFVLRDSLSFLIFFFCSLTSAGCGCVCSLSTSATVVVCVGFALSLRAQCLPFLLPNQLRQDWPKMLQGNFWRLFFVSVPRVKFDSE